MDREYIGIWGYFMDDKLRKNQMVVLICFVLIFIWMILFTDLFNDDMWFLQAYTEKGFFSFLTWRYDVWTSRLLIEGLLIFFTKHFFLWKLLNSLILTSFLFLVNYYTASVFFNKNSQLLLLLSIFTFIPLEQLNGAGWVATSTNYLWPVTAALFGFYPLYNTIKHRTIKFGVEVAAYLCLIFACNQELVAVCVFAWFGIVGLYEFVKTKKLNISWCIPIIIALFSLILILYTPGNSLRMSEEIGRWFPSFSELSFIEKIYLGVSSTIGILFSGSNYLFDLFLVLLAIASILKKQPLLNKVLGSFPAVLTMMILILSKIGEFAYYYERLNTAQFSSGACLLIICYFVLIFISLYFLFSSNLIQVCIMCLLLLMGLFSRFSLGFSPTIWGSGDRTFFIFNTCVLLISGYLLADIQSFSDVMYKGLKYSLYFLSILITLRVAFLYFGLI